MELFGILSNKKIDLIIGLFRRRNSFLLFKKGDSFLHEKLWSLLRYKLYHFYIKSKMVLCGKYVNKKSK